MNVLLRGKHAFVSAGGLVVFDVSDVRAPQRVAALPVPGSGDLALDGHHVFVAGEEGLLTLDVSRPRQPRRLDVRGDFGQVLHVCTAGRLLLATTTDKDEGISLRVLGAEQTRAPKLLASLQLESAHLDSHHTCAAAGLAMDGERAFLSLSYSDRNCEEWFETGKLVVVDLTRPEAPRRLGEFCEHAEPLGRTALAGFGPVVARDGLAFLGGDNGMVIVDCSDPANPTRLGMIRLPGAVGGIAIRGLWLEGEAVLAVSCDGLRVMDIADPGHPSVRALHAIPEARGVFVRGEQAWVATDQGLQACRWQ